MNRAERRAHAKTMATLPRDVGAYPESFQAASHAHMATPLYAPAFKEQA